MSPLVDLAIRATILLALAGIAAALLGRAGASAAMRHAAWACGIGGLIALPLLSLVLPPLEILPAAEPVPAQAMTIVSAAPTAAAGETVHWGWFAWGFYAAIAVLLLARMLIGRLRLARLWRAARCGDVELLAETAALARARGIRRRVSVRLANGRIMPMTWGTLSPKLLLPSDSVLWSAERRRFVLLHELAHVARCDPLGTLAASFACALYWFHPAVWLAASRLRSEQEHAADDLVLASGAAPLPYARDLLALASPVATLPAVAMARTTQLEQRLTAIVGSRSRRRSGPGFVLASGFVALGSTMLVAAAAPHRPPAAPPAPIPPAAPMAPAPAAAPVAYAAPAPHRVPAVSAVPDIPPAPQPPAHSHLPAPASVPAALVAPLPPVAPSPPPPIPTIPAIAPIPPIPGAVAVPAVAPTPATATTPGMPGLPGIPGIPGTAGK